LVKLVTPKGGLCLDPYAGSGTTCVAAIEEGMRFIGIERDPAYHVDTVKRVGVVLDREQTWQEQEDVLEELYNNA
jgi:site-specific DNA-methyltransferase (adenine-specific)